MSELEEKACSDTNLRLIIKSLNHLHKCVFRVRPALNEEVRIEKVRSHQIRESLTYHYIFCTNLLSINPVGTLQERKVV